MLDDERLYNLSTRITSHPKRVHDTKKVADREAREHGFEDGTDSVSRGDAAIRLPVRTYSQREQHYIL
jgi:hypothetical protein